MYVDDILIIDNNQDDITKILDQLDKKFIMKHLGEANEFLGIKIAHIK